MRRPAGGDILQLYARGYRPGMIDLSSSSPLLPGVDETLSAYPEPGGARALRAAIARLYPGLTADNVVVTNGASEALAASAFAFVSSNRRVSFCPGAYPSFTEMAARMGATFVESPNLADVVLLNNPSVPDGRLHDIALRSRAMDAAGSRLLCDEVYLDLRPGAAISPAALVSSTAVSIGDVSKPLGLGGLRIGWAISQDLEAVADLKRAVQLLSGGPSTVAMAIATSALGRYEELFAERMAVAVGNAAALFAVLRSAGWHFQEPEAGWTFCARPPRIMGEWFERSAADSGLFLASTTAWGLTDGSYRLSLFAPVKALKRALQIAETSNRGPEKERLVVVAKAPALSKTRLAQEVGACAALAVASALLEDTLATVANTGREVLVAFTPQSARQDFAERAPFAQLAQQPEGDLGDRLESALRDALADRSRAVLIGTDTPHVSRSLIDDAFRALQSAEIVVGPASDGGFYLLGLAAGSFPHGLFEGIEWSTPTVCERLVTNAARLGLRLAALPTLTDIDDVASLRRVVDGERRPGIAERTAAAAAVALGVRP